MASERVCKDLLPAMDSVMPSASCLTSFAKKKVAMEMHRKFLAHQQPHSGGSNNSKHGGDGTGQEHNGVGGGGGGVTLRARVPGNITHRRRVQDSRTSCSFERQPARCCVIVVQDFKARTDDEVTVKRDEQVKLLFIEGEWAYICRKLVQKVKRRLSKLSSTGGGSDADVQFGYIPQSHCRPLTPKETEQKRSRHRRATSLGSGQYRMWQQLNVPGFEATDTVHDDDEDENDRPNAARSGLSPTPSAFANPYLQLELVPSDEEFDAECASEDDQAVEEWRYSFRTQETTSSVVRPNGNGASHQRQRSTDSSSSSSCHSENCTAMAHMITFPGMMPSPCHRANDDDHVPMAMPASKMATGDDDTWSQCPSEMSAQQYPSQHTLVSHMRGRTPDVSDTQTTGFPYPAVAQFDFNGDGTPEQPDSDGDGTLHSMTIEMHLCVRKGDLMTVHDYADDAQDWVVASLGTGRCGTLPSCFARQCDPFPGYPFRPASMVANESDDAVVSSTATVTEQRTRPGTEMRRLNSRRRFYCDTASLTSDGSSACNPPHFGREAPDGQSIDLQRMYSVTSSGASSIYSGNHTSTLPNKRRQAAVAAAAARSSLNRRNSVSSTCLNDKSQAPAPQVAASSHAVASAQHGDRGDPSLSLLRVDSSDIPVMSPNDPSIPNVISLLGGPRRGKSPPKALSRNTATATAPAVAADAHYQGSERSFSTVNLTTAAHGSERSDSSVHALSRGVSEVNIRSHANANNHRRRPSEQASAPPQGTPQRINNPTGTAGAYNATPPCYDRSHSVPTAGRSGAAQDLYVRQTSTPVSAPSPKPATERASRFVHSTNQTRRQRAPLPSPTRSRTGKEPPPFMGSVLDCAVPGAGHVDTAHATTLHAPANNTVANGRRPGRVHSQDSAIGGCSSDDSEKIAQDTADSASSNSGSPFKLNTQLCVRKDFRAKGNSQLTVHSGEVVVVADERDHKDWLWVFAPMQRAFGFVPAVYTRAK
ncbi:uncharacterized protein LOC135821182 isoform X1 [Sycon ciliatum]|uniref:uncharacterized protein LOC135821182 isoform X1 n=1 Tax=Sycon ciliatum TaxID=27933 RepID=UPI0031F6D40F